MQMDALQSPDAVGRDVDPARNSIAGNLRKQGTLNTACHPGSRFAGTQDFNATDICQIQIHIRDAKHISVDAELLLNGE
jgi:hypothetical protein